MPGGEPWQYALGTVVTLILGYLTYRGGTIQAEKSRQGVDRTADVAEQESALQGWKELLEPYREEVREVRKELRQERDDRARQEREAASEREREKQVVARQLENLTERVEFLSLQLKHWKSLARVMARWATSLRDEVLRLGGTLPAEPQELLAMQAIIDADED